MNLLTVRIQLGNDAMLTSNDLADSLEKLAQSIRNNRLVEALEEKLEEAADYKITRAIMDRNGQRVGDMSLMEVP